MARHLLNSKHLIFGHIKFGIAVLIVFKMNDENSNVLVSMFVKNCTCLLTHSQVQNVS